MTTCRPLISLTVPGAQVCGSPYSWREVLSTGLAGGLEVATGVLALLAVLAETGSHLLAGLAFSIGFVALLLARSELFTEGFLVPVTAVVARNQSRILTNRDLNRLPLHCCGRTDSPRRAPF